MLSTPITITIASTTSTTTLHVILLTAVFYMDRMKRNDEELQ